MGNIFLVIELIFKMKLSQISPGVEYMQNNNNDIDLPDNQYNYGGILPQTSEFEYSKNGNKKKISSKKNKQIHYVKPSVHFRNFSENPQSFNSIQNKPLIPLNTEIDDFVRNILPNNPSTQKQDYNIDDEDFAKSHLARYQNANKKNIEKSPKFDSNLEKKISFKIENHNKS